MKKLYDGWTGERIDAAYTAGRLRKLEKDARRILRGLGVTPLADLMADVIRAESRSIAADVARAYLVALTRYVVAEYVGQLDADLQAGAVTRLVNHVQRTEQRGPMKALPPAAAGVLTVKPAKKPKALPPRVVEANDPPAPSLFDDEQEATA